MTTTRRRLVLGLACVLMLPGCDRDAADESADDASRDEPVDAPADEGDDTADAPPEPDEEPEDEPDEARHEAPPEEPAPFTDPDQLARSLAAAEAALAADDLDADEHARWAAVHQQAYRDLAANPGWRATARAAVDDELRDAFDLTLEAVVELWELTQPAEGLPDWRIEEPPPVDELREHYAAAAAEFGVPWNVLAAIHLVETRFGRIHGDSSAGAQGPMQFMPATWDAYGRGDVNDPRDAIMAAGRYLAASGAPDDLEAAVYAYNRSDYYVTAVLAHAEAMARHEHYLDVYHGWQVYYRAVDGDVRLEEGYGS